jgi:hypothetical protein
MAQMRVFLSYTPADSTIAATVVTTLHRVGADVWFDERAQGMSQPLNEIIHQLHERLVFIVLLSEKSLASEWVRNECKYAFDLQKRFPSRLILPIVIAPLKPNAFEDLPLLVRFKRIEGPNSTPYFEAEMLERMLYTLAFIPADQTPIPSVQELEESVDTANPRPRVGCTKTLDRRAKPLPTRHHV